METCRVSVVKGQVGRALLWVGYSHEGLVLWLSILIVSIKGAEKWSVAKAVPGNSAASLVLSGRVDGWPFLWLHRGLLI